MHKKKKFVTLSWIWNEVKVKMKGMLHIYNACAIAWHQVQCMYKYIKQFGLSRTHKVPPVFWTDAQTDARMDMNLMSPVGGIRSAGHKNACDVVFSNN